jgi:hypothetical protein
MNDKERLREIKENIEFLKYDKSIYEPVKWLIEQAEKTERYEKAIKECVERMNEGGQGTRSFIYEKLREVMEGTKCTGK